MRLPGVLVLAGAVVLHGCGSGEPQGQAKLEQKLDQLSAQLAAVQQDESARESELASRLETLSTRVEGLADRRSPSGSSAGADLSTLKRGSTSDLAWYLVTDDPKERVKLVRRRLEQAADRTKVTVENVQPVAAEVESLSVILGAPEGLDLALLQEVEESQSRLVTLLRDQIPPIVKALDADAIRASDYATGLKTWSMSSAVLGFYPSSNIPTEAAKIQQMISSHESARSRLDLIQRQRYNLWACREIRKAWKDFEEISDPGARVQTCLEFLGPIHTGLLDPVSFELYRDFLQTIRSKLPRELYEHLAEKMATSPRRMLSEIGQP